MEEEEEEERRRWRRWRRRRGRRRKRRRRRRRKKCRKESREEEKCESGAERRRMESYTQKGTLWMKLFVPYIQKLMGAANSSCVHEFHVC